MKRSINSHHRRAADGQTVSISDQVLMVCATLSRKYWLMNQKINARVVVPAKF